jgi:hypothetical protein
MNDTTTDENEPGGPEILEVRRRRLLLALADLGLLGAIERDKVTVTASGADLGPISPRALDHVLRTLEGLASGRPHRGVCPPDDQPVLTPTSHPGPAPTPSLHVPTTGAAK